MSRDLGACPLCGRATDAFALQQAEHVTAPVAEILSARQPGWRAELGACPQCVLDAARQHARARSSFSLHTRTQPNTTFPYYHPEDESVLGLGERLPDYFTLPATDVGIAFLDSGFYPHPDLGTDAPPPYTEWARLAPSELRATILAMQPRLLDYVDLTADGEKTGLDAESLWAGDFLSWHGEMTSTIAAGNGALSNGRYRGYANRAKVLPIRVGRGDGRIPEPDILRGFEWLLKSKNRKKNWQRHGVRVVNVSVGGDFPQDWRFNAISQAATRLHDEGVLIVAAAGNRPIEELLPPAQTPSVLTVGGVDDHNLRWSSVQGGWAVLGERHPLEATFTLYGHNYGTVRTYDAPPSRAGLLADQGEVHHKPEILAPANYLASPLLPVHAAFRETHAIGRLRATLRGNDPLADALVAHWQRILRHDPNPVLATGAALDDYLDVDADDFTTSEWMGDVWQPLRKRMNAQKWVHAAYQHVDGTSVATAVVSAVAAQMVEANSTLTAGQMRTILCESAAPATAFVAERRGAGVLQPASAVALALRSHGGRLTGYPRSGSLLVEGGGAAKVPPEIELRKWRDLVTIADVGEGTRASSPDRLQPVYFGFHAPDADAVGLVGEINGWDATSHPLVAARNGWWHTVLLLPPGEHLYRFCVRSNDACTWCADPESSLRIEGGYLPPSGDHSLVIVE